MRNKFLFTKVIFDMDERVNTWHSLSCVENGMAKQGAGCLYTWMCVVYKAFGDTLKMDLLDHSLSCGSEWYLLSCGSG